MKWNGRYVDPLRIRVPPAEPIPDEERGAFLDARRRHLPLLERPLEGRAWPESADG